jgi:magnesium transporter
MMHFQVTALAEHFSVEEAIDELREMKQRQERLFYVYVVDAERCLVGVLSMRDLILAAPNSLLKEIMITGVRSVPAATPLDEVARLMKTARFLALPVVDAAEHLLGFVSLDDVLGNIREVATEDFQRMFGAGAEERLTSSWKFSFSKRISWLQINLATAFLAGGVVALFGGMISRFSVLAIYLPVVSGMGSNAGAQAMAVAIRGINDGPINRPLLRHVMFRETLVGLFSGVIVGVMTALIACLWQYHHGPILGLVVGLALVFTQTLACVSGAGIPFLMRKLGIDPAQSASIFATTITDVAGFASLLGLAKFFENWMR